MNGSERAPAHFGARELFLAHAPFVARFLARLGVPRADVDDRVQEVFLTAHRLGGFTPDRGRATTWLAAIAIRIASTARRTLRRRHEEQDDEALTQQLAPGADPHERAEVSESLARVNRALAALDIDQRAVFVLFEVEGETSEAIALGLGVPVGTVHSRLHRARKDFQRAYDRITKERSAVPRLHPRPQEGAYR
jgi:RNA polymerase sigma-70 factor (ECF subfamily)